MNRFFAVLHHWFQPLSLSLSIAEVHLMQKNENVRDQQVFRLWQVATSYLRSFWSSKYLTLLVLISINMLKCETCIHSLSQHCQDKNDIAPCPEFLFTVPLHSYHQFHWIFDRNFVTYPKYCAMCFCLVSLLIFLWISCLC